MISNEIDDQHLKEKLSGVHQLINWHTGTSVRPYILKRPK